MHLSVRVRVLGPRHAKETGPMNGMLTSMRLGRGPSALIWNGELAAGRRRIWRCAPVKRRGQVAASRTKRRHVDVAQGRLREQRERTECRRQSKTGIIPSRLQMAPCRISCLVVHRAEAVIATVCARAHDIAGAVEHERSDRGSCHDRQVKEQTRGRQQNSQTTERQHVMQLSARSTTGQHRSSDDRSLSKCLPLGARA
jgi:hypothetical protein